MSERWLILLNALTARLLEEPALMEEPQEVLEEFVEQGYQPKEVESAFAWIARFVAGPLYGHALVPEPIASHGGLRARSTEEQLSFSPEAFGYLLRLENSGLIDPSLREEILERALVTFDDEIGEEEIKAVSRMVLMDHGLSSNEETGELDLLGKGRARHLH